MRAHQPWGPHSHLTMGTRSTPGVKREERGVDHVVNLKVNFTLD